MGCGGDKAIVSVRLEIHPFDEFPGVGRMVHHHGDEFVGETI